MTTLHISPEAQEDLQNIKEYISIDLDNPISAQNVILKIIKTMRNLEQFPDMGASLSSIVDVPTDYRILVSGRYLVFYRHEKDEAHIIRILYGKRDYMRILFGELPEEE